MAMFMSDKVAVKMNLLYPEARKREVFFCDRLGFFFFFFYFMKSLMFSTDPGQRIEFVASDEALKIRSQIVKWQL